MESTMDKAYPYVTRNRCDWCGGSLKLFPYNDADTGKRFCSSFCFMRHATSERPDDRQLELEFLPPEVPRKTVLPSSA